MSRFDKRDRYEVDVIIDKCPCAGVYKLAGLNVFSIVFAGIVFSLVNNMLRWEAVCNAVSGDRKKILEIVAVNFTV